MKFTASAEVESSVGANILAAIRVVIPYLNEGGSKSLLSDFDIEVRYIPIIMSDERKQHYPARSKIRKKGRLYDCAPQLDFETLVTGAHDERLAEYLHGLRECATALPKLGATAEQVEAFLALLRRARAELAQVPPG